MASLQMGVAVPGPLLRPQAAWRRSAMGITDIYFQKRTAVFGFNS